MAALQQSSGADQATYNYLHTVNQLTQDFAAAGDQKVEALGYWNPADPDASAQNAKLYAYGLAHYCLQYSTYYGTAWKSTDASAQSAAITKLINIMGTSSSLISDISVQLGAIFSFNMAAAAKPAG